MILIDFNQYAIASMYVIEDDIKKANDYKTMSNLMRHITLSSILSAKKKFSKQYGELVICADATNYWRKSVFPQYKASRKENREQSNLDWNLIFQTLNSIREDLKEHFPYRVIHVDTAETDDVFASIVFWSQENNLKQQGLVEEPEPILLLSSDGDFKQLHKYKNVKQWSPKHKKYVETSSDGVHHDFITKIVKGDRGDGIPNIRSKDDQFTNDRGRQAPLSEERVLEFVKNGIEACKTDEERRNFQRNMTLIDLHNVPTDLQSKIIDTFINTKPKGNRMSIFSYLQANRCRELLNNIEDF